MTCVIFPNGQKGESGRCSPRPMSGLVHACTSRKIDYREMRFSHGVLHMTYHRLGQDPQANRWRKDLTTGSCGFARLDDVAALCLPSRRKTGLKKAGPLAEAGPECISSKRNQRPQASCRYFSRRLRVTSTGQVAPSSTRVTTLPMITFSSTDKPRDPMTIRSQSSSSCRLRIT